MPQAPLEPPPAPLADPPPFRPPGRGGETPYSPLHALRHLKRPIENWPRALYHQPVWRAPIPGVPIMVMDPTLIRAILVGHAADFPQGALFRRLVRPVWGRGLLPSEGEDWRWQRRAAAPAFRPARMAAFAPTIRRAAEAGLDRWRAAGADAPLDIAREAAEIVFDVVLETLLGGGERFDRAASRPRLTAFFATLARMRLSYFFAPDVHHEGRALPDPPDAAALRAAVDAMLAARRDAPPRGDLVDLLMASADPETGRPMDGETLRDNILGFIAAGFDTTAVALGWVLHILATHPPTLSRLRAEVAAVTGGAPVDPSHVEALLFTRQIVDETLRLYPPAHSLTRVCTRATALPGLHLRAGQRVVIPVYALHRHHLWWRDPDLFDPDRFAAHAPPPDRHLYMPFGAGPRICLGAAFALTELVVLVATLSRAADFTPDPTHRVWPSAELALKPEGGLPMTVRVQG